MKTIARHLRLIKTFFSFRMSNQMIYRASFWTAFFVDVSLFLIHLAVFQTLFFNVDSINGWSKYQMVFFVGTFTLIDGLEMWLYFFGVTSIPMKIREGKLDIYLTKPVNTLFWLTFEKHGYRIGLHQYPGHHHDRHCIHQPGYPHHALEDFGLYPAAYADARAFIQPDAHHQKPVLFLHQNRGPR